MHYWPPRVKSGGGAMAPWPPLWRTPWRVAWQLRDGVLGVVLAGACAFLYADTLECFLWALGGALLMLLATACVRALGGAWSVGEALLSLVEAQTNNGNRLNCNYNNLSLSVFSACYELIIISYVFHFSIKVVFERGINSCTGGYGVHFWSHNYKVNL